MKKLLLLLASALPVVAGEVPRVSIGWNTGPQYQDRLQVDAGSGWQNVDVTPVVTPDGRWAEVELDATAPSAMFRVARMWSSTAKVTYAWDPSPTDTVTEYVLYGGEGPSFVEIDRVPSTELTMTVRLLNREESVYVTARTPFLESDPSNTVLAPRPDAPTGLMIKKKIAGLVSQSGRSSSVRRNLTERAEEPRD